MILTLIAQFQFQFRHTVKKNTGSCKILKFNVYRAHTAFQNLENVARNVRQDKGLEIRIFLVKFSNCCRSILFR